MLSTKETGWLCIHDNGSAILWTGTAQKEEQCLHNVMKCPRPGADLTLVSTASVRPKSVGTLH